MDGVIIYDLIIVFKNGETLKLITSDKEIDWLFDRCFGRSTGGFSNFGDTVVNINEIAYFTYEEIKEV